MTEDLTRELGNLRRELANIRQMMTSVITYIRDAESEVPERIRRFMNYMHDAHDVKYMYEELGHAVPPHLLAELERLDDRYRQILKEMNAEGGAFAKVRAEMASDPENRWDHTRLLPKRKDSGDEARKSNSQRHGVDEGRTEAEGDHPGLRE